VKYAAEFGRQCPAFGSRFPSMPRAILVMTLVKILVSALSVPRYLPCS
jgi:hypothetical protein